MPRGRRGPGRTRRAGAGRRGDQEQRDPGDGERAEPEREPPWPGAPRGPGVAPRQDAGSAVRHGPFSLTRANGSGRRRDPAPCDAEPLPTGGLAVRRSPRECAERPNHADRAGNSDALENLARVGLIAYGVVHLLVAWLALQLAWFGGGGQSADQSGAMATLAESPVGKPLLWVLAVGLIALAVWQAAEVLPLAQRLVGVGQARTKAIRKSGKALVKAIIYLALAVLAIRFATGGGQSSSQQQQQTTAGVFDWPAGSGWSAPPASSSSASARTTCARA